MAAVLLIGINDISWPGTDFAPDQRRPTLDQMIAGYQQVMALARTNNVRLIGATLPPFKGALSGPSLGDYHPADKDTRPRQAKRWTRERGPFRPLGAFDT